MTQPITTHTDIVFAEHDGTQLLGDLYLPHGPTKAPVLVGVHGGGWQLGNRQFYNNMGTLSRRQRHRRVRDRIPVNGARREDLSGRGL